MKASASGSSTPPPPPPRRGVSRISVRGVLEDAIRKAGGGGGGGFAVRFRPETKSGRGGGVCSPLSAQYEKPSLDTPLKRKHNLARYHGEGKLYSFWSRRPGGCLSPPPPPPPPPPVMLMLAGIRPKWSLNPCLCTVCG